MRAESNEAESNELRAESDSMSYGYVDHLNISARANNGTDYLFFIHQARIRPLFRFRFLVLSTKPGFGTSNRRFIQNQSQMRGESKPPWVRDPLSVYYHQVRLGLQLRECCE